MKTLNINGLRNSSGRHVIKATIDNRETLIKGVHNNLNVLNNIAYNRCDEIHFIIAWKRIDGRTFRYRWTPQQGWQMLKPSIKSWYTFK